MKLYANRSNAKRALNAHAKKLGTPPGEFVIVEQDGQFGFRAIEIDEPILAKLVPNKVKPAPKKEKAAKKPSNPKPVDMRHKSEIENPVQYVWSTCESLYSEDPTITRKKLLAVLDVDGIAYYTARTQYQLWRKTKIEEAKKEAE